MTETAPTVTFNRLSFIGVEGSDDSLGKPVPNTEVKVIAVDDPKGIPLGPNQQGELLVRGPQVMKGYFNRTEENVFLDGWLRTGDMMYYNKQGFLFITDRLKELIKVKGFQVSIYIPFPLLLYFLFYNSSYSIHFFSFLYIGENRTSK